ncbi:hypothetical protein AB4Y42_42355 [Paraburkholderia sp. EG286B]|uniref:hypothetical protein n=1 Tax=Paraburkholderia sp. EG286B TaxID=3237011 RepID=UPI0034D2AB2A
MTASMRRTGRLEVAPDGKSLVLIDVDQRKPGTQREVRYEITPAELIAAIRAHGAELAGESHAHKPLAHIGQVARSPLNT